MASMKHSLFFLLICITLQADAGELGIKEPSPSSLFRFKTECRSYNNHRNVVEKITSTSITPMAFDDNFVTNQNIALNENVSLNDSSSQDGGNVWSVVLHPVNGSLSFNSDGTFSYTPSLFYSGKDSFYYRVCDIDGDCDDGVVVIMVNENNSRPLSIGDSYTTNRNTPLNANVSLNDVPSSDGGNTWTVIEDVSHGVLYFDESNGSFTYTPRRNFSGSDTFYYRICDANDDCDTAMAVISINQVNNVPTSVDNAYLINEDVPLIGNVANNDIPSLDGGNLWSIQSNPNRGGLVFNPNGTFTYTPLLNSTAEIRSIINCVMLMLIAIPPWLS